MTFCTPTRHKPTYGATICYTMIISLTRPCASACAARTLVVLCSASPRVPEPRPAALDRRALLHAALAAPALAVPNLASASEVVASGQLQYSAKLPPEGVTATITARVVGRNTKGPLATLVVQDLGATPSPVEFAITRDNLREVPDFIWLEDDLYLKADVEYKGKTVLVGRGKAKAVAGEGSIESRHKKAAIELE